MSPLLLATLAITLPGLAALLAALFGYLLPSSLRMPNSQVRLTDAIPMLLTCTGVVVSALLSWVVFIQLWQGYPGGSLDWFTWLTINQTPLSFGVMLDKLSATMFMVVTTVSACVHIYSIGYMQHDTDKRRFFIYLSLFTISMMLLVSAPNLMQMFLGWEGVGLCSYLLIGFWYQKHSASAAAIKAFIVNRVADAALLVGLFLMLYVFGSLNYTDIFSQISAHTTAQVQLLGHNFSVLSLAALLVFIGAMGKSAQFGLHTWLPDAMEGPTPVSALIHAATMVTAGVFLLCRLSPLYEAAPDVLMLVAIVGAVTALFAATVGLTQPDIKRVIAYSTCSQLGYMFFAIGVSAYPAAMFHLTTHAFFKALLFLAAGSVIHAMHHEQNIFRMGALRTALPITYGLMWVGSLALAGIPPFAGFFSKDLILESAWAQGQYGPYIYTVGVFAALLTAIYSFRVLFMVFHGAFNAPHDAHAVSAFKHAHESPLSMRIPMVVLAVGAVAGGYFLSPMGTLEWWHGAIAIAEAHPALHHAHHVALWVKFLPLLLALAGAGAAWYLFDKHRPLAAKLAHMFNWPYKVSLNKWYIDELYFILWQRPTQAIGQAFQWTDKKVIDGIVDGTGQGMQDLATSLRPMQTGYVYNYAFTMVLALVLGLGWLLWSLME